MNLIAAFSARKQPNPPDGTPTGYMGGRITRISERGYSALRREKVNSSAALVRARKTHDRNFAKNKAADNKAGMGGFNVLSYMFTGATPFYAAKDRADKSRRALTQFEHISEFNAMATRGRGVAGHGSRRAGR